MPQRRQVIFFLATIFVLVLAAFLFVGRGEKTVKGEKIRVVTTFLPIYVFTKNVTGDLAEVENLLPPGAGPHEYSFTPGDVQKISRADVLVMNGLGAEAWAAGVIKESGTMAKIIDASVSVPVRLRKGTPDPHIWLSPTLVQMMVANIAAGLAAADPKNAAGYQSNAEVYLKKIQKLADDYDFYLESPAIKRTDFIAFHAAFGYFAERFGLIERAVIEEFPGKEPGAKYLAGVVDLIRREKVRALFSEPQFSPKVLETVAKETGLRVRQLDTAETGPLLPDTYELIMRKNLETLIEALSE